MSKRFDNISEEDFLKNKAKRKSQSGKKTAKKNKKPSKNPVLKGFLIALGVLLGIIILAVTVAAIYYFAIVNGDAPDNHNDKNDNFINSEGNEVNRLTGENGSKKYFTFLATATDKGGSLTDVIMVARFHYDDKEPEVSLLQIPRDTYVKIATDKLYFTEDGALSADNFTSPAAKTSIKINEAFYRGRSLAEDKIYELLEAVEGKTDAEIEKLLKQKQYVFIEADAKKVKNYAKTSDSAQKKQIAKDILRDFGLVYLQTLIYYDFGIPIDYHAQVNINGFRGVVNAIGGVDLNVPVRMYYVDEYQDLYIDLYPGQQHLNGAKAEQYVRFRGYPGGDVARLEAQKLFIDAFLDKLLSFSTVSKIDDIITEIQSNIYTDVSFNNMLKFASKLLNMDLKNDVKIFTLPGVGEYIGPVSYFVADRDEIIKLVNEEFNVFNTPLIDEDFKVIDDEDIYRPASVVTDNTDGEETSADPENSGEDENGDEPTDEDSQNGDSENEDENGVSGGENGDNTGVEEGSSDSVDNSGEQEDAVSDNDDSGESGDEPSTDVSSADNSQNNDDTVQNETSDSDTNDAEQDENYQLLLDMAA